MSDVGGLLTWAIPAAFAGLVVLSVYGLSLIIDQPVESRFRELQLRRDLRPDDRPSPVTLLVELLGRAGAPPILRAAGADRIEAWEGMLDAAGRPAGLTASGLVARKVGYALLFAALGLAFTTLGPWWMPVALGILGFVLPDITLKGQIKERQEAIDRALPDFLDVLSVTVSAGLDFRAALARVADAFQGPLSDEIRTTLQQMMLGEARREALESLRRRNRSESLNEFVSALQQAEELGAPLTDALSGIALDVRRSYAQQARRQAAKVEPRLSVILTVTLIPAAIIIVAVGSYIYSGIELGELFGGS
jgi:tight adherence protein C